MIRNPKRVTQRKMNIEALKFHKLDYISVGLQISWDETKKQKKLELPKRWPSATLDTNMQYFNKYNNGIALLTGDKNDLYVVDCDVLKQKDRELGMLDGAEAFQALITKYKLPEACPTARSSSGGLHYFFSLSKSLEKGLEHSKNTSKIIITKGLLDEKHDCRSITIDTRGDGGCIIVAPTAYNTGGEMRTYKWLTPLVASSDLPAMPDWCIRLINESQRTYISPGTAHSRTTGMTRISSHSTTITIDHNLFIKQTQSHIEALQNSTMSRIWMRTKGYDYALTDKTKSCVCCSNLHTANHYMVRGITDGCYWMRNYSTKCNGNVYNWESHPLLRMVLESPCTDAPYSRMLREKYHTQGFNLVYTPKDRFLNFNGTVWEEMDKHVMTREVDSICGLIMDYLVKNIEQEHPDEEKEKEIKYKVALFRQGRNFLRRHNNLNGIVIHYKQMYIDMDVEKKLDTNPDILAVKNGIIDLRTGELREGRDIDYMMTQLDTVYEPDGKIDMIVEFVNSVFNNDQATIAYVQKLLGYGITGHTREQCWAIFTGSGSNGKSLFISLIESLMEKWYTTAAYDVFFKNERRVQAGGPSPHLAALKGARICVKEETEPKDKLNVEMIKIITGESTVTTRQLYAKEYESFVPVALPILLCNHKPAIDVDDDAMLRRIKVVPFNNIYTAPDDINRPYDEHNPRHRLKDPELRAKLLTAYAQEQLLTWLVQGAVKWYVEGLGKQPQSMIDAFNLYKDENDKIKIFINAKCELPPLGLQKSDMKGFYVNAGVFREALNEFSNSKYMQKDLVEMMARRGFKYTIPRGIKEKVYMGLRMQ